VRLKWSFEPAPLEVAGGIATAIKLLPPGPALIVAGDVFTAFDYRSLRERAEAMARDATDARAHLVLVPNPPYHPDGDFALVDGRVALDGAPRQTYASIGVYDTALFRELPRGSPLKLLPYLQRWIADGRVSGESFDGTWANVGSPADLAQLDAELNAASVNCTPQPQIQRA
jgi:MurNAc alpha-1-phosphate uridylyltransferase